MLLLICLWDGGNAQLNKFKVSRHRAGSSKFSLNPLKPLMNLMRQDPMKAAAQRPHPKYLPPPPNMFQQMSPPARTSSYGMHPYRPYPSHSTRILPPTSISLMPPMSSSSMLSSAPSSMVLSALVNDHQYHHYRPQASDLQIKAVRIPSKSSRRPASVESLNIADSVVRQLLDLQQPQQQQQQEQNNYPSVLVIEDPDVASSSNSEIFGDSLQHHQKVMVAPPVHAELSSDTSDMSSGSSNNPEVFVIVSKNKNKHSYYSDDKKSDILSTASSSPKLKKYKITSAYDEAGGRQVWIIKR